MNRSLIAMAGGIVMTALSGSLLLVWLNMNTGSGFVGLLWIGGVVVGLSAFANGAAALVRGHDPIARSSVGSLRE